MRDRRVQVFTEDVFRTIRRGQGARYDAILLDVDNGPTSFVQKGNARIYSRRGFNRIANALQPGGRVAFWSATDEEAFGVSLARAGFRVHVVEAKSHDRAKRFEHRIYVGETKPRERDPNAPPSRQIVGRLCQTPSWILRCSRGAMSPRSRHADKRRGYKELCIVAVMPILDRDERSPQSETHRRRTEGTAGADRRRERRAARRVHAHLGEGARLAPAKAGGAAGEIHTDAAGNLWATLRGESEKALLIGGHIDSVPNGGWLDGCLNVLAGVEILRRIDAQYDGKPPVTVRLVDWADEEGARFGKSLFGSSACSGHLDMDEARGLKDKDGITLPDALRSERHRFRDA